jgi:hypothetical protein
MEIPTSFNEIVVEEKSQEELLKMFEKLTAIPKKSKKSKKSKKIKEYDYIFNESESNAILQYTQETPPSINSLLRGDKPILYKGFINNFILIINCFYKIEPLKNELIVYRGININDIIIDNDEFIIDNLISTTDDENVAIKFSGEEGGVLLKILLPTETLGLNIGLLSPTYTRFILDEGEEMILLPGKFNIVEKYIENNLIIIECIYSNYRDITSTLDLLSDRIIDIVEVEI